jgi:hypothetical protein
VVDRLDERVAAGLDGPEERKLVRVEVGIAEQLGGCEDTVRGVRNSCETEEMRTDLVLSAKAMRRRRTAERMMTPIARRNWSS